jgi:hypothetical protein
METRQHQVVITRKIVVQEEEISNTLIDYFFEGRVPPECVKLSEDIHANPMFRLRWYEC